MVLLEISTQQKVLAQNSSSSEQQEEPGLVPVDFHCWAPSSSPTPKYCKQLSPHIACAGKGDGGGEGGSLVQQLAYRKAAMFALARQAEASSQAASRSEGQVKVTQSKLGELKSLLAKVTTPIICFAVLVPFAHCITWNRKAKFKPYFRQGYRRLQI